MIIITELFITLPSYRFNSIECHTKPMNVKKPCLILLTFHLYLFSVVYSQNLTLDLGFLASYEDGYLFLDSIRIQNLTQDSDTILFYPDKILQLPLITGMKEGYSSGHDLFRVTQNVPNPFTDQTSFNVIIPEKGFVEMIITNVLGKRIVFDKRVLEPGSHLFTFQAGSDRFYLLSVSYNGMTRSIKMIFNGNNNVGMEVLQYPGIVHNTYGYKMMKQKCGFLFSPGDTLKFTGFVTMPSLSVGSDEIVDSPQVSKWYTFNVLEGIRCPGMPSVTDIDGNEYSTVLIGIQCWMRENLRTTSYNDGTSIQYVADTAWSSISEGAFTWYDNDSLWKYKYGALYNGYTLNDSSKLCPPGWHVPNKADWERLVSCIGGYSYSPGNSLKSCRQVNSPLGFGCNTDTHPRWDFSNDSIYGTDIHGFTALPGGKRLPNGSFQDLGGVGSWWSVFSPSTNLVFSIMANNGNIYYGSNTRRYGNAVRCIRGGVPEAAFTASLTNGSNPLTVFFTDQSINGPMSWVWEFGDGTVSTVQNPSHTYILPGDYTVQLTASNSYGSDTFAAIDYISVQDFNCGDQFTDVDGNIYNSEQIGNFCWMKENLKTTTYRNGTPIPNVTGGWHYSATDAYAWYDNNPEWKDVYGALYSKYAVHSTHGLCPEGWFVPSNDEWMTVINYIGGPASPAGNKLKSCRQINSPLGGYCNTSEHPRWIANDLNYGTDDYGFSGLPGGTRYDYGPFMSLGGCGYWWTSTMNHGFRLRSTWGDVDPWVISWNDGLSVRCAQLVPGSPPEAAFTADITGGLAPLYVQFTDMSTNIPMSWLWDFGDGSTSTLPNPLHIYYSGGSFTVQLTVTNVYGTATEVKTNFIIVSTEGLGEPCPGIPTVTYQDQVYNTVLIGEQCWLKENLNVGSMITGGTPQANNGIVEKYCYDNNPEFCNLYGGLYDWNEMMNYTTIPGAQGICPPGWHIPTDDEWKILEGTVDSQFPTGDTVWNINSCRGFDVGKNLKYTLGWANNGTDLYGFKALPGGNFSAGNFSYIYQIGFWWTSTADPGDYPWIRYLGAGSKSCRSNYSAYARSVRCLKDD